MMLVGRLGTVCLLCQHPVAMTAPVLQRLTLWTIPSTSRGAWARRYDVLRRVTLLPIIYLQ